MTALPESDAATSLVVKVFCPNNRLMASATATPSTIAPSTMLSGGIGSVAKAVTLNVLPTDFQFDGLDGARADVEADHRFVFCEDQTPARPLRSVRPAKGRATRGSAMLAWARRSPNCASNYESERARDDRPFRKGSASRFREDFE